MFLFVLVCFPVGRITEKKLQPAASIPCLNSAVSLKGKSNYVFTATTVSTTTVKCSERYPCRTEENESYCAEQQCDGTWDCADASDEENCWMGEQFGCIFRPRYEAKWPMSESHCRCCCRRRRRCPCVVVVVIVVVRTTPPNPFALGRTQMILVR